MRFHLGKNGIKPQWKALYLKKETIFDGEITKQWGLLPKKGHLSRLKQIRVKFYFGGGINMTGQ